MGDDELGIEYDEPVFEDELPGAEQDDEEAGDDSESDTADEAPESTDPYEADAGYIDNDSEIEDGDSRDLPEDAELKELLMQLLSERDAEGAEEAGEAEDIVLLAASSDETDSQEETEGILEVMEAQNISLSSGLGIITFGIGFAVGLLLVRLLFGGLIGGSDRSC